MKLKHGSFYFILLNTSAHLFEHDNNIASTIISTEWRPFKYNFTYHILFTKKNSLEESPAADILKILDNRQFAASPAE